MNGTKKKILFPYVEAGFGHIVPLKSIKNAFETRYGDEFEIIETNFYTETNDKNLKRFNDLLCSQVRMHNRSHLYGHASTAAEKFWGAKLSNWFVMKAIRRKAYKAAMAYMNELKPDIVVSSHWATNYYAMQMEQRPMSIVYVPDAYINKLFRYPADLVLTHTDVGYAQVIKSKRFNYRNLKVCKNAISSDVNTVNIDKSFQRKELGIDKNKFTVCISEGGYGIGKMGKIIDRLIKLDKPYTVIAVCGRNKKLYEQLSKKKTGANLRLVVVPLTHHIMPYLIASDLYCGKAGANSMGEAAYFAIPTIITGEATFIEEGNAKYYESVGCACRIKKANKIVEKIIELDENRNQLLAMKHKAEGIKKDFGADDIAEKIHAFIKDNIK